MHWAKIPVALLGDDNYSNEDLATWLRMLLWLVSIESADGKIISHMRSMPVSLEEFSGLLKSNLVDENNCLMYYPSDEVDAVKVKRISGKKGGRPRKKPYGKTICKNHMVEPYDQTREDNIREDNIREDNKKTASAPEDYYLSAEKEHEKPATISKEYAYAASEPWVQEIIRAGGKVGPQVWVQWKRIIADHGMEKTKQAIAATQPTKRWPDKIEEILTSNTINSFNSDDKF